MDENRLLSDIREVADELGKPPTAHQYNEHGSHGSQRIFDRYGTWDEALDAAGVLDGRSRIVRAIRITTEELMRVPTILECSEHGGVEARSIYSEFDTWDAALEAAGVDEYSNFEPGRDDLAEDLDRVNSWLGRPATMSEYEELGNWSPYTVKCEFGNWTSAQEAVGEDISHRVGEKYSRDELLDDIARVYNELGRRPTATEYRDHGNMSVGTISGRFDGFAEACRLAEKRDG